MKNERRVLGLGVLALLLAACEPFAAHAPKGFAAYDDWRGFRAASADGVVYRVRRADNDPEADLSFWREALKKRMLDAGYAFLRDGDVEAHGHRGYLLELAAPLGERDYQYVVALFVAGGKLVLVESAGEVTRFAPRHDDVVAAIRELEVR